MGLIKGINEFYYYSLLLNFTGMNKVELFDSAEIEIKGVYEKDYLVMKALWIRFG